jgi:multicomponent Na+:H+ antiporter subunit B
MSRRVRLRVFGVAACGLGALLFWALAGLPEFGHYNWPYGKVLNLVVVGERHATNVVSATVFDYRGFDTLGEEFILFASVLGVALLLRKEEEEDRVPADEVESAGIRSLGLLGVILVFGIGLWIVAFGLVTPGGGFQGGVVLAGALLLLYAAGSYRDYHALTPHPVVEFLESFGVGAYAVLGFVGLAAEAAYLRNFLGIGDTGTLYSGGSMSLLNWATGIEVVTAMVLLFGVFLTTHMIPESDWKP